MLLVGAGVVVVGNVELLGCEFGDEGGFNVERFTVLGCMTDNIEIDGAVLVADV